MLKYQIHLTQTKFALFLKHTGFYVVVKLNYELFNSHKLKLNFNTVVCRDVKTNLHLHQFIHSHFHIRFQISVASVATPELMLWLTFV